MRLIDADGLLREVGNYSLQVACNKSDGRLETMTKVTQAVQDHTAKCIADAPTIDPETLPIVRRLRAELVRVRAERDALLKELAGECGLCKHYDDCTANHYSCTDGCDWEWCGPRKEE